ncbi:MAG: ATP-binding cassette domain-containing protein [Polyangiaceae bacterium]|nr:ATP-binding cassette domain-containing protein [Polyangiaceae bacterium]
MTSRASLQAHVRAKVGRLDIDVDIEAEGTLVVVGPNGAGKSTLLSLLLGVLPAERGRIEVAGTVLLDTSKSIDVPVEHRRLGYVPQDYALFPHMTVRQNIEFALSSAPSRVDRRAQSSRIEAILAELKIDHLRDRRPETLSGGEKQRVALARALSVRPRALLLDEPLAALDIYARREVRAFLARYLDEIGLPTLVVTHDAADARALGHSMVVLEAGRITQSGTWEELEERPASPFVEELVRAPTS